MSFRDSDDDVVQGGFFGNCIVWDLAEVHAWLLARRAKPIQRAQHPDVTKRKSRPVKGLDRA